MSRKLIATMALVFALGTAGAASTAQADPTNPNWPPDTSGVCNMLHVANFDAGMANSSHGHGYDLMADLIFGNDCIPT
jgi:hypothetical protein